MDKPSLGLRCAQYCVVGGVPGRQESAFDTPSRVVNTVGSEESTTGKLYKLREGITLYTITMVQHKLAMPLQ